MIRFPSGDEVFWLPSAARLAAAPDREPLLKNILRETQRCEDTQLPLENNGSVPEFITCDPIYVSAANELIQRVLVTDLNAIKRGRRKDVSRAAVSWLRTRIAPADLHLDDEVKARMIASLI
jgi:hypothetical protein